MKERSFPGKTVNKHTNAFIIKFTVLIFIGLLILVLSLIADLIGLGEGSNFGSNQIWGTIAGAVMFVIGLSMMHKNNLLRVRNIHNDMSLEKRIDLEGQALPSNKDEVNDLEISPTDMPP